MPVAYPALLLIVLNDPPPAGQFLIFLLLNPLVFILCDQLVVKPDDPLQDESVVVFEVLLEKVVSQDLLFPQNVFNLKLLFHLVGETVNLLRLQLLLADLKNILWDVLQLVVVDYEVLEVSTLLVLAMVVVGGLDLVDVQLSQKLHNADVVPLAEQLVFAQVQGNETRGFLNVGQQVFDYVKAETAVV